MRIFSVVSTGLFPVKTCIYMPNNFKWLGRRPFCIRVKNGENFAMYSCRFDFKFEGLNRVRVQFEPGALSFYIFYANRPRRRCWYEA